MAVKYELTLSHHVVVMSLEVEGQVVRPGEGPVTHPTLEGPIARVFAHVPGQLVGAGKLPATVFPRADVRFLSRVGAEVGLEVAGLGVALAAAGMLAGVGGHLPL